MARETNIPNLRDWPDQRVFMPSGRRLQRSVDAVRALATGRRDLPLYPAGGLPRFPATIVANGPNGESDYTDNRYWIQPAYIAKGKTSDAVTIKTNSTDTDSIITATNFAEQTPASHFLDVGQYVMVEAGMDYSDPRQVRFFMVQEPTRWRHVRVLSYSVGNGKYDAIILEKNKFTAVDPTVDFQYPDNSDAFGVWDSSSTVLLENVMESKCHSKMLSIGSIVLAYKWGFTNETPPRTVYRCQVGGPGYAFFVNLAKDGGVAGTSTTAATYTYTIYPGHRALAGTGEPTNDPALGTTLAPVCRTFNPTGRPAGMGIAAYLATGMPQQSLDVALTLIWVNEDDPNL